MNLFGMFPNLGSLFGSLLPLKADTLLVIPNTSEIYRDRETGTVGIQTDRETGTRGIEIGTGDTER